MPSHHMTELSVCTVSMIGLILNASYMSALRTLSLLVTPFTNLRSLLVNSGTALNSLIANTSVS